MSNTLKAFLKLMYNCIVKYLVAEITDTQFGFRNKRGFVCSIQTFLGTSLCSTDFENAFEKFQNRKLMEILKSKNIDSRDKHGVYT